jgi:hypothetical protein
LFNGKGPSARHGKRGITAAASLPPKQPQSVGGPVGEYGQFRVLAVTLQSTKTIPIRPCMSRFNGGWRKFALFRAAPRNRVEIGLGLFPRRHWHVSAAPFQFQGTVLNHQEQDDCRAIQPEEKNT